MIHRLPLPEALQHEDAAEVTVAGLRLGIFKQGRGYRALELKCGHQLATLWLENRQGNELHGLHHGWRYGLPGGECLTDPLERPLRSYAVTRVEDELFVDIPAEP